MRHDIGALAAPEKIHFTPALPKTRSGKIMRRILRKIAEGATERLRRHLDACRPDGRRCTARGPPVKLARGAMLLLAAARAVGGSRRSEARHDRLLHRPHHADNVIKIVFHGPHKLIVDSVGGGQQGRRFRPDRRSSTKRDKPVRKRDLGACSPTGPTISPAPSAMRRARSTSWSSGNTATIRYTMKEAA